MVELDGISYVVKTPEENVSDMITFINNYCTDHNIRNRKGEIISIDANTTNPLYMVCYGLCYLISKVQRLMYSVGCAFSIQASSDQQLLTLADLAKVQRKGATHTSISCLIYADTLDADDPHPCVITKELSTTVSVDTGSLTFHPAYDVTIPIGETALVILIAEEFGSYDISAGEITGFDTVVEGLRKIESQASIPGQNEESIPALRARLQDHISTQTQLDRAAEAIEGLDGVSLCNIYFNPSLTETHTINNVDVLPRHVLLIVQGYNDHIAETFYKYVTCETTDPDDEERLVGGSAQIYTTRANQQLPVYIVNPVYTPVYIKIYISGKAYTSLTNEIKDALLTLSVGRTIGQDLTAAEVINLLKEKTPGVVVRGAYVSTDGESWGHITTPSADALYSFLSSNITVIGSIA